MNGSVEKNHEILMKTRTDMKISGVSDVESFDETGAVFHTACGMMTVEGKDIRIEVLDVERGVVTLCGRIDGVFYSTEEHEPKRGLFGKRSR